LAADIDGRLHALERNGRSGSRLERAALERFARTGVAYRRALHRAAHGERLPGTVLPTVAQLADWRALTRLYADGPPVCGEDGEGCGVVVDLVAAPG
jgi:hypothetical protein